MNEEINKYVADQKAAGFTTEQVRAALVEHGYRDDVINTALAGETASAPTVSQTGSPATPIQVENVQYNVEAKDYRSKPGLVFAVANACLAIGLLVLASLLHQVTGVLFGYSEDIGTFVQLTVSLLVPLAIIGFIAVRRMNRLFAERPELLEDIKFKSKLRKSFIFFLVLAGLGTFITIFNVIGIFTGTAENVAQNTFFSIYYVGGLIVMTLWLYSYQRKTNR